MVRNLAVLMAVFFLATAVAGARGSARAPVPGVIWSHGGELAALDPLTLKPVRLSGLHVKAGYSAAVSPDGRLIALQSGGSSTIRIVSAGRLRVVTTITEPGLRLGFSVWPRPNRIVTAPTWFGQGMVAAIDPQTGRVVSLQPLPGTVLNGASSSRGLVLLLGRQGRIGPVRLAVVDADGSVRMMRLPTLRGGIAGGRVVREAQLGLAVDPSGRRAAIVAPGLLADVDLTDLTVTLHRSNARRPSLAAKTFSGWTRRALWATPSLLAISGTDYSIAADDRIGQDPAGLSLVDTRTWETRIVEPEATEVVRTGPTLLATGVRCNPSTSTETCGGIGLRGYALDGTLRFHLFGDETVATPQLVGGLAYLTGCNSFCYRIVDPAAGRLVGRALTKRQTVILPG